MLRLRSSCNVLTRIRLGIFQNEARRGMSNIPVMPPCSFHPKKYKGISLEDAIRIRKHNLQPNIITYYKKPVLITQGHMQWLFDETGKRYLDMFAGIVTVSVGHCHPKVTAALKEQLDVLWHTTSIYLHPKIHEYAEKLVSHLPGDLKVCFFTNSGSEANDLAMTMARLYTKNFDIISLRNAYHGTSPYTMGLTALSTWKQNLASGFGVHHVMNPDVYRGQWGGSHCKDSPVQTTRKCSCKSNSCVACDNYIAQLEEVLNYSVPKKIAGFFAEPIQGVGGAVQFPKQYLQKAYALIRKHGGICIADEVQTGFGRTGEHFWGFQMYDVIPDIVTVAKGMGNGIPVAALITTPEIAQCYSQALYLNTFGGNPLSCATGIAVLDAIKEDKCQENSLVTGTFLLTELAKLRDTFDIVGDVRGKGLMIGVELVTDKESKTPLPADEFANIMEDCKDMGLLIGKGGYYGNVFRIKPPMCITKDDAKFCASVLEQAFSNHQAKYAK